MSSRTEAPRGHVDILMYHSVAEGAGPTSVSEPLFRAQMEAVAEAGRTVVSLDDCAAWLAGQRALPDGAIVITFDDGFRDFAEAAFPVLKGLGFTATVFLPTGRMGGPERWTGAAEPPRPLMSWDEVAGLAREGIAFGAHSVTHADLTALSDSELLAEIKGSKNEIEARLAGPCPHFAPPYGLSNEHVRSFVRRFFATSCGTRLGRATERSDPFDLPRLEMHYFRDMGRWRAHLAGRGGAYLAARGAARLVRGLIAKPWM